MLDASVDEILAAVSGIDPTFTGTGGISATHIDFNGLPVAGATGVAQLSAPDNAAATTEAVVVATTDAALDETTSAAAVETISAIVGTTAVVTETTFAGVETTFATADVTVSACEVLTTASVTASTCVTLTTTVSNDAAIATQTAGAGADSDVPSGTNVQSFTGALGGIAPAVVSSAGDRPFTVNGNTFVKAGAAIQRSCDIQHNACANAANSGSIEVSVADCDAQQATCAAFDTLRRRSVALNEGYAKLRRRQAAIDTFGTCTDPSIVFETGLDGRDSAAFIASNQDDFNHGSALGVGIIAGFICQRLSDSCKASADVVASCTSASAAAVATS